MPFTLALTVLLLARVVWSIRGKVAANTRNKPVLAQG
jgi:hypothetical protein